MRDYSRVGPTFWTGKTGRRLREEGTESQLLALYLITCPSANMIGLFYLPLPVVAHEMGLTLEAPLKGLQRGFEGVRGALEGVIRAGFASYDNDSEYVFVPEMAAWQVGEQLDPKDNRVKSVWKELESCRKSVFYMDFYNRYKVAYHLPDLPSNGKPLQSPFEAPLKPLRSQDQNQEQNQEQKLSDQKQSDLLTLEVWKELHWQDLRLMGHEGDDATVIAQIRWLVATHRPDLLPAWLDSLNGPKAMPSYPANPVAYVRKSFAAHVGGLDELTKLLKRAPRKAKCPEPLGPSQALGLPLPSLALGKAETNGRHA